MQTSIGWVITGLAFMASVEAYFVTVDAHAEECFFDKVTLWTHLKIFHLGFAGEVWDKNGPHVWGGWRGIPRHWCQNCWTWRQDNPPGKMPTILYDKMFRCCMTQCCIDIVSYNSHFRAKGSPMENTLLLLTWTASTSTASPTRCPPWPPRLSCSAWTSARPPVTQPRMKRGERRWGSSTYILFC